jgi:hypothetical protein
MAILDKKLELMDDLSFIIGASVSIVTSNVLNLGTGYNCWADTKYNDIGEGGDLWLNIRVGGTTILPAACVFTIYLVTDSTAANCLLGRDTTSGLPLGSILAQKTITSMSHTTGKTLWRVKVPASTEMEQFLALYIVNSATAITAGTVNAWIGLDSESEVPTS